MGRHPSYINFYSSRAELIGYCKDVLDKALSGFVIGVLDLPDYYLVVDVYRCCSDTALFLYIDNEFGEGGSH